MSKLDLSKKDYKKYSKEYRERGASSFRRSRSRFLGKQETEKAYREHLSCQAMIRNMNWKMKNGYWLYNDLPDGHLINHFRIIASGNPSDVGKLMDSFGREYDVPRKGN
tara:strand:+ start:928 stop:1254 length:327 start_codon:yes stop_codon:yes gene_type:complete